MASAFAVGLVVIAIVIVYAVRGHGDDDPTVRGSSPLSTSGSPTASETRTPTASETSSPSPTPTDTLTPPPTTPPPAVVPGSRGAIYVYAAPGATSELSAAVAAFKAAGYSIKKTNSVGLNPSRSTVYYGRGNADEANAMVGLNIGVQAAAPRPAGYADPTTLFVVVTRTFS